MTHLCIICAVITGSLPIKEPNSPVPIPISAQIASMYEGSEARTRIVDRHPRDDMGRSTTEPGRFATAQFQVNKWTSPKKAVLVRGW